MDRRVEKTKTLLYETLISLMAEKENFEQISIKDIADKANVNRGTIYFHFHDKYDILDKCIGMHLEKLFIGCAVDTPDSLISHTFSYLERYSFVFKTLLNDQGATLFRVRMQNIILQSLESHSASNEMPVDIKNHFLASAVIGLLEWWITQSMPYSVEDMVMNFSLLVKQLHYE
ncbi:TetR/AcrR family transcriptional regulator [Eubacteriales bacterium OttesenSCG-928-A19]|nr:TetR/AcrR family transcriptional regulator [Eubacteriales bacterium OttesenSCG-928-A19]